MTSQPVHEPSFLMVAARRMGRANDFNGAIELLIAAIMKYPHDALFHSQLGKIYDELAYRLADIPATVVESEHLYRNGAMHHALASDLKPLDYSFAFKAAADLADLKQESAMLYALRAIDIEQDNDMAWYFLGKIFQGQQENAMAAVCYRNAILIHAGHRKANEKLQELHQDPGARRPFDMEPYHVAQRQITGLSWSPFQLVAPKP